MLTSDLDGQSTLASNPCHRTNTKLMYAIFDDVNCCCFYSLYPPSIYSNRNNTVWRPMCINNKKSIPFLLSLKSHLMFMYLTHERAKRLAEMLGYSLFVVCWTGLDWFYISWHAILLWFHSLNQISANINFWTFQCVNAPKEKKHRQHQQLNPKKKLTKTYPYRSTAFWEFYRFNNENLDRAIKNSLVSKWSDDWIVMF